jgi:hypothetical protein
VPSDVRPDPTGRAALGTILEISLYIPGLPRTNVLSTKSNAGVNLRLQEAVKREWLSQEQCGALEQLWTHRNNVHLKVLENSELGLDDVEHVNASHAALLGLMAKLKAWYVEQLS